MNKKFLIGLFIISLIALAGGCGGSSHSGSTNVNTALNGAWSSSTNGTATITSTNNSDDLEKFVKAFGEISGDLLKEYEEAKKNETVAPVNTPVTNTVVLFEDCKVEESSGTATLTAIIILSGDSFSLPVFYDHVAISTQRSNKAKEWTATIPDGSTLSIKMTSNEKINFSGKVRYLDYDCEFSTVVEKNLPNSIDPEILDGVWKLDGSKGGGYLAEDSVILSAVIPESVSMYFKTDETLKTSLKTFYSLYMKTSGNVSNDEASLLQTVNPSITGTLTQISGNLYKFGDEGIIFIENTDEIFAFMAESNDQGLQTCMFLPLKKVSFDIESALKKTWTGVDGGGYIKINTAGLTGEGADIIKSLNLESLSFALNNAALNFSNANTNAEDSVTININVNASFLITDKIFNFLNIAERTISASKNGQVTMSRVGNFLQFTESDNDGKDVYDLLFLSENEAFLSIVSKYESIGEGNFVLKFRAN